jgi:hypothetical protein
VFLPSAQTLKTMKEEMAQAQQRMLSDYQQQQAAAMLAMAQGGPGAGGRGGAAGAGGGGVAGLPVPLDGLGLPPGFDPSQIDWAAMGMRAANGGGGGRA